MFESEEVLDDHEDSEHLEEKFHDVELELEGLEREFDELEEPPKDSGKQSGEPPEESLKQPEAPAGGLEELLSFDECSFEGANVDLDRIQELMDTFDIFDDGPVVYDDGHEDDGYDVTHASSTFAAAPMSSTSVIDTIVIDDVSDDNEDIPGLVDTHFRHMEQFHADKRQRKRRRTRRKQPPIDFSIPNHPRHLLSHAAKSRGVTPKALKLMIASGLPMVVLNCLVFLQSVSPSEEAIATTGSELFAGAKTVALAWRQQGHKASTFEINDSQVFQNILLPEGWLSAILMVRNQEPGSLTHIATVCSTWIYLSRASTKRALAFPEGDTNMLVVQQANTMTARIAIIIILVICLGGIPVHEQPITSLLSACKFMVWARNIARGVLDHYWIRMYTWMGAFGAELQKPTELICTQRWIFKLKRKLTADMKELLLASRAVENLPHDQDTLKRRVTGSRDGLKESQTYPLDRLCHSSTQILLHNSSPRVLHSLSPKGLHRIFLLRDQTQN